MRIYELTPTNGQKSFYGKAIVKVEDDGTKILESYRTPIIKELASGELIRLYDGWTPTTGKHIKSFCGLNKKEYMSLGGKRK